MTRTEKQTARRLPIGRILLIAFIVMPIIEIAVLIQVGGWLGLWPTIALIILTAIAGTWMLRQQGFAVLIRAQTQLERGTIPVEEVFEGLCLVIAGALLLTPGFVTDAVGGALLLPPLRAWLYRTLGSRFRESIVTSQSEVHIRTPGAGDAPKTRGQGAVVEGEFETMTPDKAPKGNGTDQSDKSVDDGSSNGSSEPMPPPRGSWDDKS